MDVDGIPAVCQGLRGNYRCGTVGEPTVPGASVPGFAL